ncbi:MAG: hypothetical protein AB7V56_00315 [Candidatus Nitrosocosmicus sp.]
MGKNSKMLFEERDRGLGNHYRLPLSLPQTTSKNEFTTVSKNTESNKIIYRECEALECTGKATEQVKVSAGKYGIIVIYVCKNCTHIFANGVTS